MSTVNHDAVFRAYPNVVTYDDGEGAFDAEGNPVVIDMTLVDAVTPDVERESFELSLRLERNKRLAETDYLALSDATLTDEMRTYRQELRDLPANTTDPANPTWPTKP